MTSMHTLHLLAHKLLPSWIYDRLIGQWDKGGFKKYFHNTSWMLIAKIASFVTSFITIALVARYLGPDNLGKISYAQSIVSILSVFAALGIDQILYRDLVAHPEKENELLGTAILAKLFFGSLAFITVIGISILLENEPILTLLIAIIAFTFLINPLGTISIFFQSRVQAKYSSQVIIFLALFIPILKVAIIFFDKGILYFSLIFVIEALLNAIWLLYIYITKIKHNPLNWRFSITDFKLLISRAWPLLLASLSGYIYGRIDQVMILHFIDAASVGFYDIAVRMTEFLGYLPGIIITSVLPAVINAKKKSQSEYLSRLKSLTILCILVSFFSVLLVSILSPLIINTIFGQDYSNSINILRLYSWSSIGTIFILLIQQYLIIEGKSMQLLIYSVLSALTNVGLNLILIPLYGVNGAIYATLTTLFLTVIVFYILNFKHKSN